MTAQTDARAPRVFAPDDPKIVLPPAEPDSDDAGGPAASTADAQTRGGLSGADVQRGIGWGGLLVSAMAGLAGLAASVSFAHFVSAALERQDWVGWTALGLLSVACVAAFVIVMREVIGLLRLRRLTRLRRDVEKAVAARDRGLERSSVRRLRALFRGRGDVKWALARVRDHEGDVRDPGELLKLADREILVPLDVAARRSILKSAKRVSVVTAISPVIWIAMIFVAVENLRLLRALAGLYGGRPGTIGALRLARMVVAHIIATGGLALTDDLLGQFLGQDLLRRLSRRLGEGAFNGALTARIGAAAVEVTRPLPYLDAEPVRARDILPELFRRRSAEVAKPVG
jgi:putative membrane protein